MKIILLFILFSVSYTKDVILLLGCHINDIQEDRIQTAISYVGNKNVTWYLSGGVKYHMDDMISEAKQMSQCLRGSNWEYIIDDKAQNTAENFVRFRLWLEENTIDKIIIVTSKFHKKRAQIILQSIIPDIDVEWVEAKKICLYCKTDETKHMSHVDSDIKLGLELYDKLKHSFI